MTIVIAIMTIRKFTEWKKSETTVKILFLIPDINLERLVTCIILPPKPLMTIANTSSCTLYSSTVLTRLV